MTLATRLRASLLALSLILSPLAYAGSPGAWSVVFIDISPPLYKDGQKLTLALRKLESLPAPRANDCFLCSGNKDDVNSVNPLYIYTVPAGLSPDALRRAVDGDETAKREMQTVLKNFEDSDGVKVDGLVIYDHQPGKVTLYTMTHVPGQALEAVSKPVKNHLALSSLDMLLEKAVSKLPREI